MEMTREKLEEIIGSSTMRDYDQTKEYAREKLHTWAAQLSNLADEDLVNESSYAVFDAAVANSRGMYWDESWVRSGACMHEARKRHLFAGHTEDCHGDNLYVVGYNRAYRDAGHGRIKPVPCDCEGSE